MAKLDRGFPHKPRPSAHDATRSTGILDFTGQMDIALGFSMELHGEIDFGGGCN